MKKFLILLFIFVAGIACASEVNLRDYDEFQIPTGTHIPVINLEEFSTAYCEEGDSVKLSVTNDIYLYDKNVIPEGSRITGYIEKKHEPIVGTNASMQVFINKLYLPDGYEIPIKGYIYTANKNIIGGELTPPAEYIKIPHYQRWSMFRTHAVLQCVPGATRKMGEHVTVSSGANLIVVLVAPINMSHTVIKY